MIGSVSRRLRQRDWLPYVLGVAFVALLSVLLAGLAIRAEHERRRQYAGTVTRNLALLVEAQLAGVLAQADLRLQAQAGGGAPLLDGWRAALPTPAPGLSVTGPLRDEQGSWVIRLSRPAASPSQPPLQLSLPVEEFGAIIERVDLGPHGAVAIRSADLALIYRQPMPPGGSSLIGSREVSAELKEAVAATPEAGDFVARTALDGIARINAFQRVDNYPFYVLVGLPEDDFPHGWNPLDTALMAVAMITLVAVATGAGLLLRLQRRQVGDAWRRFEVIVTSSHDAILTQSLDGMVLSWNPAAERILGWRADEVLGRPIRTLVPAECQEEEAALLAGLARGEQVQALRTERLHRDGRRIPMSITITPILDDATGQRWASVIARDITAEVAMEAEIRKLAFLDPLTQLPNRRLLLDRLQQAQQASRRHLQWAGLIYLDLDRFKALNDRHGHEVGDLYLIEVARRLRACVRESDTVARLGGDEFVLLCAELGPDEGAAREAVLAIEAKLAQAVSRAWQVGDVHHAATASLGHRLFRGADEAPGELLGDADAQMYRDKQRHPSRA